MIKAGMDEKRWANTAGRSLQENNDRPRVRQQNVSPKMSPDMLQRVQRGVQTNVHLGPQAFMCIAADGAKFDNQK